MRASRGFTLVEVGAVLALGIVVLSSVALSWREYQVRRDVGTLVSFLQDARGALKQRFAVRGLADSGGITAAEFAGLLPPRWQDLRVTGTPSLLLPNGSVPTVATTTVAGTTVVTIAVTGISIRECKQLAVDSFDIFEGLTVTRSDGFPYAVKPFSATVEPARSRVGIALACRYDNATFSWMSA